MARRDWQVTPLMEGGGSAGGHHTTGGGRYPVVWKGFAGAVVEGEKTFRRAEPDCTAYSPMRLISLLGRKGLAEVDIPRGASVRVRPGTGYGADATVRIGATF